MPTITKEQVAKMNSGLRNGFVFDVRYYLTHSGEKTAVLRVPIDAQRFLEAHLWFEDESRAKSTVVTAKIVLHISLYRKTGTDATSAGLGLFSTISSGHKRKMFSKLQEASERITPDYIVNIARQHYSELVNATVIDADGVYINNV